MDKHMGISGRRVWKDLSLEDFIESVRVNGGVVKGIAQQLHLCRQTIYDIFDENPELEELRQKYGRRFNNDTYETAQEVIDRIMENLDENPDLAAKQAQFVLKNSKVSAYREQNNEGQDSTNPATRAIMAQIEENKSSK